MSFKKDVLDKHNEISSKIDNMEKKLDLLSDNSVIKEYYSEMEKKMNSLSEEVVAGLSEKLDNIANELGKAVEKMESKNQDQTLQAEKKTGKGKTTK
ncbi:TVG0710951 [Thermoplasma volcanium GSS1]|uniref:TVG0710951 protein n=1 Tax=Thermoplasma volcanium (strain ATCC 51530 / DSM 4299 / JCM 9571 / NBRC 15438 / GSS1) TaxID=273116 RepID=Q97AV3_THEVO|nr:hypothetical protein [Thermoplasma volcanium]BAB59848.1 TVG0710951 [Thermoplasma volcanium GSS1]